MWLHTNHNQWRTEQYCGSWCFALIRIRIFFKSDPETVILNGWIQLLRRMWNTCFHTPDTGVGGGE